MIFADQCHSIGALFGTSNTTNYVARSRRRRRPYRPDQRCDRSLHPSNIYAPVAALSRRLQLHRPYRCRYNDDVCVRDINGLLEDAILFLPEYLWFFAANISWYRRRFIFCLSLQRGINKGTPCCYSFNDFLYPEFHCTRPI